MSSFIKVLLSFFSIILIGLIVTSCEEDNPINTNPEDLIGSWTRTVTDSEGVQFEAKITFDGSNYHFEVLTDVSDFEDSTGNYVIENGLLKMTNDSQCYDIGYYNFSVIGNSLTFTAFEDFCEGRKIAIQGVWTKL